MKRTEKSVANSRQKSIVNSRQKSIANSRQDKSIANGRQINQKTATETKRSTRINTTQSNVAAVIQPASPETSKNRCRCPAASRGRAK